MSGGPRDLDDESMLRIARSFYVVKMARYAALVVAALAIAALAASRGAPDWVPVTLAVLAVAFVAAMAVTRRRYLTARRRPPAGTSAPSPTG
ncbi:MAG TPA: hypothetical protein DEQ43_15245 [Nocardioides bacterium]|nr:hypothetical protein [Nocardioides sp.]